MTTARFSIERDGQRISLRDDDRRAAIVAGPYTNLYGNDAIELRNLLLRAFPVETPPSGVPAPDVQAQNSDHDAEMFRRGWMAGQADALKQIDAARAEEREAWMAEIREQRHDWFVETSNWPDDVASLKLVNEVLDELIRARSGAKGAV